MSLEKYSMTMPRTVYSGKDALENLKTIVKDAKKVAIFTDRGILSTGLVDLPLAKLQEAGKETIVISDLPPEPTYMQVQKLVDEFKASGADFIVAVGGGSAMDTAKLASLLATERYTVKDLLDDPTLAVKTVKICLIPTTAGTGSEATPNAIVAVPEQELKIGIVNSSMVPDYVVLDAEMIRKLPRKIAAATGIDAMAHAIECFTSNKANPFSDIFALEAFDLIMNNIETACDDPRRPQGLRGRAEGLPAGGPGHHRQDRGPSVPGAGHEGHRLRQLPDEGADGRAGRGKVRRQI